MKQFCLIISITLPISACVTIPETAGTPSRSSALRIVCEPRNDLGSPEFKVIGCSFINDGTKALTVQNPSVEMVPAGLTDGIVSAEAIARYRLDGVKHRAADSDQELAQFGSLIVIGALAAEGHSHAVATPVAAATFVATSQMLASDDRVRASYSSEHLLGPAFSLGAHERVSRLLLMDGEVSTRPEGLKLCLDEPAAECFDFNFGPSVRARAGAW